jgi:hypothetical protein
MFDLGFDEQLTLELIAAKGEHTVFDGGTLCVLHQKGLVEMSIHGWDVTPLGRLIVDDFEVVEAPCGPVSAPAASATAHG